MSQFLIIFNDIKKLLEGAIRFPTQLKLCIIQLMFPLHFALVAIQLHLQKKIIILVCLTLLLIIVASTVVSYFNF